MDNFEYVLTKEDEINDSNKYIMTLYNNGSFITCYNKSAFLCRYYNKEKDEKKLLKVLKSKTKNGKTYVKVGFPITSFSKFLPGIDEDIINTVKQVKSADIDVSESYLGIEITNITISSWMDKFNAQEKKNKEQNHSDNGEKLKEINEKKSEIFMMLLSYDVEKHSSEENKLFIDFLKGKVKNIIELLL